MSSEREKEIGARLRSFRESLQIPRSRFAVSIGFGSERIASYESGRSPLPYTVFKAVAQRYPINPLFLGMGRGPIQCSKAFDDAGIARLIKPRALFSEVFENYLALDLIAKESTAPKTQQETTRTVALPSFLSLVVMEDLPIGEPEQGYFECLVREFKANFEKLPHRSKGEMLKHMAEALLTFVEGKNRPSIPPGDHDVINKRQDALDIVALANDNSDMQVIKSIAGLRQKLTRLTARRGGKAALARKLKVSRQAVDQWLNGTTTPSTDIAIEVMNLE